MPDRKGRSADNATVERDESTVPEQPAAVQTTSGRGRGTKRPRRAASPEKGLSQAAAESQAKRPKRSSAVWSTCAKNSFFRAVCEHGRDFDRVMTYMARQCKATDPSEPSKNKDQVRHMYYRTWNKVQKMFLRGEEHAAELEMKKNSKLQDNSAHAATAAAAAVVGTATTSLPSVSSIGDGAGDETEAEASADLQVLASDNPSVESEDCPLPVPGESVSVCPSTLPSSSAIVSSASSTSAAVTTTTASATAAVSTASAPAPVTQAPSFIRDTKNSDLLIMIGFAKLRKRCVTSGEKFDSQLYEIVTSGSTHIRDRDKRRKVRICLPSCRALRPPTSTSEAQLANQADGATDERPPLPPLLSLDLVPHSQADWSLVQTMSFNPRIRLTVAPTKPLLAILSFLQRRFQLSTVVHKMPDSACVHLFSSPENKLCSVPLHSLTSRPVPTSQDAATNTTSCSPVPLTSASSSTDVSQTTTSIAISGTPAPVVEAALPSPAQADATSSVGTQTGIDSSKANDEIPVTNGEIPMDDGEEHPESPLPVSGVVASAAVDIPSSVLPTSTGTACSSVCTGSVGSTVLSGAPACSVSTAVSTGVSTAVTPASVGETCAGDILSRNIQTHGEVTPSSSCSDGSCSMDSVVTKSPVMSTGITCTAASCPDENVLSVSTSVSPVVECPENPAASCEGDTSSSPTATKPNGSTLVLAQSEGSSPQSRTSPNGSPQLPSSGPLDVPQLASSVLSSPLTETGASLLEQEAARGLMSLIAGSMPQTASLPESSQSAVGTGVSSTTVVSSAETRTSSSVAAAAGPASRLVQELREQSSWSFSNCDGLSVGDIYEKLDRPSAFRLTYGLPLSPELEHCDETAAIRLASKAFRKLEQVKRTKTVSVSTQTEAVEKPKPAESSNGVTLPGLTPAQAMEAAAMYLAYLNSVAAKAASPAAASDRPKGFGAGLAPISQPSSSDSALCTEVPFVMSRSSAGQMPPPSQHLLQRRRVQPLRPHRAVLPRSQHMFSGPGTTSNLPQLSMRIVGCQASTAHTTTTTATTARSSVASSSRRLLTGRAAGSTTVAMGGSRISRPRRAPGTGNTVTSAPVMSATSSIMVQFPPPPAPAPAPAPTPAVGGLVDALLMTHKSSKAKSTSSATESFSDLFNMCNMSPAPPLPAFSEPGTPAPPTPAPAASPVANSPESETEDPESPLSSPSPPDSPPSPRSPSAQSTCSTLDSQQREWLQGELANFSMSGFPDDESRSPERQEPAGIQLNPFQASLASGYTSDSMESAFRTMMDENSVDFISRFSDLAGSLNAGSTPRHMTDFSL